MSTDAKAVAGGARIARIGFLVLSWLLLACIALQMFTAGLAVFHDPAKWSVHTALVHLFEFVPALMAALAFIGRMSGTLRWLSFGALALIFAQYATANMPGAGAAHPVIALALFWAALTAARRAWREADLAKRKPGQRTT